MLVCIVSATVYVPGLLKFGATICTLDYRKRSPAFLAMTKKNHDNKTNIKYFIYRIENKNMVEINNR